MGVEPAYFAISRSACRRQGKFTGAPELENMTTAKLSYVEITDRAEQELQWLANKRKSESPSDSSVT
jgi:hypothetical protein